MNGRRGFLVGAAALAATPTFARWEGITRYPDPAIETVDPSFNRSEHDGSIATLATHFEGKRLNAPNDIVVKSDDSIWFTDHSAGILGFYEGERAPLELPTDVYRLDGRTREIARVATGITRPNGLAFSPDESILCVVEAGTVPRNIRAFGVSSDGRTLDAGRICYQCVPGEMPDGFRVDVDGNLWCGWGMSAELDGVRVINKDGKLIGKINLPIRCANLAFGGRHQNRLFMTCGTTLMSLYTEAEGAA